MPLFSRKNGGMLVKFLIKKQGKRNNVDDLAQVYMRVRGGRSVDVTVMIDLKVNPLDFEALFDEFMVKHPVSEVRAKNNRAAKLWPDTGISTRISRRTHSVFSNSLFIN